MVESAAPRTNLRVGAMVRGKYRIDAFIASGSMSNVYAATHRNGSRVALKILHRDLARDTSFAERFRREGYFGNAVVHSGIVRAIDDDMTDDGCAFLVFDLLEGETLEQKRSRVGGKLPLSEVLGIGDAVLDVLQAAHDHQILHRDLKPDNVYLTRSGEVKLFDFGAARFNDGKSTSDMTGVGMVIGTPAFMAPEQAAGKREDVDARSDVWGVGAMLFVCLTGQAVHLGGDLKTKAIAVARTKARSLRDVAPEIPRVVAAVIDRALAFDKAERYADAKSMREALGWARRSLTGEDEAPVVSEDPATRRHRPITDDDDNPTMAGSRAESSSYEAVSLSDLEDEATDPNREKEEETEKRTRIGPRVVELLSRSPEIKRPVAAPSEGVITSAPPVTLREKRPPSMPPSEGPTFSLRQDPVFSLREQKGEDPKEKETADALEHLRPEHLKPPQTERLPRGVGADEGRAAGDGRAAGLPRGDGRAAGLPRGVGTDEGRAAAGLARAGSEHEAPTRAAPQDPDALFRAALERGLSSNDALGGQVPPAGGPRVIVEATPLPAAIPRAPVPLVMPGGFGATAPLQGLQGFPGHPGSPGFPGPTGPPPPDDPIAKAHFRSESVSTKPPPGSDQFSSVRPGPLVASVTGKPKGSGWRILVPILIGVLAGVGTYVLVMRQKAARAHEPAPAPSASVAEPSSTATPSALVAPPVLPLPSASASVSAAPPASAAPSASVPKKKPKPKPKPPPEAPAAEPPPSPELL